MDEEFRDGGDHRRRGGGGGEGEEESLMRTEVCVQGEREREGVCV